MNLSIALIVKNEELTLERCLKSVKDLANEIIIIDTGSTDKTKEIALQHGAKIFDFKWVDDFSAARNFSFSKCTSDFILWLDADDEVKPEDYQKIKNLDYSDKQIILCKYYYLLDEYNNPVLTLMRERIVKRSLNLMWEQPIHEYLPLNGKTFTSDIAIHHYKKNGTSQRNLKILEKIILKNPKDSRLQYYLGKEYFDFGKFKEAKKYLQKFVSNKFGWWEDKYSALLILAKIHYNEPTEFKKYILKCIDLEERRAEAYFLMGQFFFDKKNWLKAIHWYTICINTPIPKDLSSSLLIEEYTWKPALQLVLCYNNVNNLEKANECNEIVLKYRPNDSRALNNRNILNKPKNKLDGQCKKLNLGCGKKTIQGYENVDNFKADYIDAVYNLYEIPYLDNTISEINSEHSIEHVMYEQGKKAIKEWFRVLSPGGILNLKLPDLELCIRKFLESTENRFKEWYKYTIFGYQKALAGESDDSQIHRWGYTKEDIQKLLEDTGFVIDYLENYDGNDTPSIGIRAIKPISNLKIGWITPVYWDAAQTRIRVLNIDRWLRSRGYKSKIVNYPEIISQNYDVAIVGKTFDENHFKNIRLLKQHNKTVFCDLCEDILDDYWVNEIIKICDKVICCSHRLAEKVAIRNPNVEVIEDAYEN